MTTANRGIARMGRKHERARAFRSHGMHTHSHASIQCFFANAKTLATLGVGLADGRSRLLNAAHVMHLSGVNGLVMQQSAEVGRRRHAGGSFL